MNRTREWAYSFMCCSFFVAVFAIIMTIKPPENEYKYLYDITLATYVLLSALLFGLSLRLFNELTDIPTLEEQISRGRVKLTRNFYFVLNKDPEKGFESCWYLENCGYYVALMFYDEKDETFTKEEIKRLMKSLEIYGVGGKDD